MAREVTHEATGPEMIDPDGQSAICMCGLTDDAPFCDGSHAATGDEGDALYKYEGDDQNPRHEIEEILTVDEERATGRGDPRRPVLSFSGETVRTHTIDILTDRTVSLPIAGWGSCQEH